jgi:pimeloyl-ACP methyl ester carboxylesterase
MSVVSEYLVVRGIRQHFLRAGSGEQAIVLVHGNSHCGGVWAPLAAALADDGHTVIAPDLRGHGWTEKPEGGYDWGSLRDDVVGLVKTLELHSILFVGHSRGGGVALLSAAATPERTRGAVVYEPTVPVQPGPNGEPAPVSEPPRIGEMIERTGRRRQSFPDRGALAAHYRQSDGFRAWREDYFQAFLHYGTSERPDHTAEPCVPPRAAARLFEATFGFDAWHDVRCPDLPVLALYGDQSGRIRPDQDPAAGVRTMFPRCDVRVMQEATHTGPMEHPDEFERLIREFAARLGA